MRAPRCREAMEVVRFISAAFSGVMLDGSWMHKLVCPYRKGSVGALNLVYNIERTR